MAFAEKFVITVQENARKTLRYGAVFAAGMLFVLLGLFVAFRASCDVVVLQDVALPYSDWSIRLEHLACSALDDGTADIIAENNLTHERKLLVEAAYSDAELTLAENAIVVTKHEKSFYESQTDHFLDYKITFKQGAGPSYAPDGEPESAVSKSGKIP